MLGGCYAWINQGLKEKEPIKPPKIVQDFDFSSCYLQISML